MGSNKDVKLSDLGGYYLARPTAVAAAAAAQQQQNNINGQQQHQWVEP